MTDQGSRGVAVTTFFDEPSRYLQKRFGIRVRKTIIGEFIRGRNFGSFLEVGCGDGSLSIDFLVNCQNLFLIDISDKMVELARRQMADAPALSRQVRIFQGDFHTLPDSEKFDLILCVGVVAHVDDVEISVKKLSSLLNEGGGLILQFTDHNRLLNQLMRIFRRSPYRLNKTKYEEMVRLVFRSSLHIENERRYMVPFPGMKYFSDDLLFRMQMWLMRKRYIGLLFTDCLWLLQKEKVK